ncbi:hypothetical protein QBC46DRAFT_338748 [Diplogelasinospora grovesii]|uniref:Uncharacterized protein n=1 Tax=Diplogelasinospora grovesii TaxID=303347 RepID=A0AAN6S6T7_9PEZI|nr:hypothetical protein QBC46DRAFT_338748 [Diplogelasinospora grovesii]
MSPPPEVRAVVVARPGTAEIRTVSLPKLRAHYLLVCTTAVVEPDGLEGRSSLQSLPRVDDAILKEVKPNVDNGLTLAYTILGEPFEKGRKVSAGLEDYGFGKMFLGSADGCSPRFCA